MLERSRQALKASILIILSLPLVVTTLAVFAQRDRALAEVERFSQPGSSSAYIQSQCRTAWRDAERVQWAVEPLDPNAL